MERWPSILRKNITGVVFTCIFCRGVILLEKEKIVINSIVAGRILLAAAIRLAEKRRVKALEEKKAE
ncbi:hypothetical protein SPSIL_020140 [Sporomusa silvacetica DSM 10669]|uniref:Uncharacterized protein n=1 Tax=Sporomusa silvacetica DSM 10669 TaxID=1123289 RepID=A0ABZ3IJK4_9FIRM|nr:hypothetical protein SPSIL_23420 [Sporomusa silvacetica DSM 10669]